jgi:hypothetical protein
MNTRTIFDGDVIKKSRVRYRVPSYPNLTSNQTQLGAGTEIGCNNLIRIRLFRCLRSALEKFCMNFFYIEPF